MKMSNKILSIVALAATLGWASGAHAAMQTFTPLPEANCGTPTTFTQTNNCIQYGDFTVYSLGLLYVQATYASTGIIPTTNPNPGDPFYVASSEGQKGNDGYIVYGAGANNNNVTTNGPSGLIDDAQVQATGTTSSYVVSGLTETDPLFAGDDLTQWTGTLTAVRTELGAGSDPTGEYVIYFTLNETGNDGLEGIDLLAWAHITLTDTIGCGGVDQPACLPDQEYYFGGETTPVLGDETDPNWVYVHGTICVSATAGFLGFGECTLDQLNAGGVNVNQNLGENTSAFAIYNEELSDLVLNSGYDFINGEWMFDFINNGPEQIFSALQQVDGQQVPEPGTLLLFGMGLTSLVLLRSRKNRGSKK